MPMDNMVSNLVPKSMSALAKGVMPFLVKNLSISLLTCPRETIRSQLGIKVYPIVLLRVPYAPNRGDCTWSKLRFNHMRSSNTPLLGTGKVHLFVRENLCD